MLENYLKIAWRTCVKNRTHSVINIAGLAIGMGSFLLILLYVLDESHFDKFLNTGDQVYQVDLRADFGNGDAMDIGKTPASVSSALARNFPEIESASRVYRPGDVIVRSQHQGIGEKYFTESAFLAVDSSFLQVFAFPLLKGERKSCLQQPNSVVITESIAKKYFGDEEPMGKFLVAGNDRKILQVTGVLKDLPHQSTFQFDLLSSMDVFPVVKKMSWSWVWLQVCTYVKLREQVLEKQDAVAHLEAKFPAMIRTEGAEAFRRVGHSLEDLEKKGGKWELHLQSFSEIHLYSAEISQVFKNVSDIKYVYIFSAIAFFILVLACANFMNLSTARASHRAREVGVRKVLGSEKKPLVKQFLAEAAFFSTSAALIAFALAAVALPAFNSISGKAISLQALFTWEILLSISGLILVTTFLAGSYPAFYLASFNPGAIIKGVSAIRIGLSDYLVRNGLVTFQFVVSMALIICTLVVFRQMRFMQSRDLGFDQAHTFMVKNTQLLGVAEKAFRQEIAALPGIEKASTSTGAPTKENFGDTYLPQLSSAGEKPVPDIGMASFIVDEDFIPALDIRLLQGRNFSKDFFDSTSVILNEEAVKAIGWRNPVGSYMTYPGNNNQRFKVIGVVKDFNINSLHSPMQPFALFHTSSKTYELGLSYLLVRSKAGDPSTVLRQVEEKWKVFAPATPFDVAFLDEEFNALYFAEQRLGKLFSAFTLLSIFVACLGLFGLVIHNAESRRKEIGIRKVLGAQVHTIMRLLSLDFIKPVALAAFIAVPLAWWAMNKWLQDFAYRIQVEWWLIALSVLLALFLTLLTVSWQTFKAAVRNPIKNLRTE